MTWILWVIVGFLALGAVANIATIGKERTPLTPGVAALSTVISALVIWGIIAVGIFS